MHKITTILFVVFFVFCINLNVNMALAIKEEATYGTLLVKEYKNDELKASDKVTFTISGMYARVDISDNVYYLINLSDEKTYVINKKRQKATLNYASNIIDKKLPPLVILKNRVSLKKYLTSINANLQDVITENASKYEVWHFNIDQCDYIVKVKLPEFFPKQVVINFKKNKMLINVEELKKMSSNYLEPDYFMVPQEYKIIDLITKK
ncbi:MAG: hypothetical protein AB7V50_07375 [Vampirovibrionia bacterium]